MLGSITDGSIMPNRFHPNVTKIVINNGKTIIIKKFNGVLNRILNRNLITNFTFTPIPQLDDKYLYNFSTLLHMCRIFEYYHR